MKDFLSRIHWQQCFKLYSLNRRYLVCFKKRPLGLVLHFCSSAFCHYPSGCSVCFARSHPSRSRAGLWNQCSPCKAGTSLRAPACWRKAARRGQVSAAASSATVTKTEGSVLKHFGRRSPGWCLLPSLHLPQDKEEDEEPYSQDCLCCTEPTAEQQLSQPITWNKTHYQNPGHQSQQLQEFTLKPSSFSAWISLWDPKILLPCVAKRSSAACSPPCSQLWDRTTLFLQFS